MRFENPQILWLLLVIPPVLALFFWWALRARQKLLTQFVEARLLATLTVGISPARRKLRFALVILAVVFLSITLARPQRGFDLVEVAQRELDIVVAVDTSKSMLATDIAPSRLERAKLAVLELLQRAGTDRMGLVAFAGDAFLECPLTIDDTAFAQSVSALDVNTIPQGGTALAVAINTALAAFKENDAHKVLVLFTDGEDNDNESGALAAAKNAAKAGLKIFTIGIGSATGTMVQVTDGKGGSDYVRDPDGNVVKSHLNESLLQQIATATDGFYLPLRGANTMDTLYERGLAPLPKSEGKGKSLKRYHEQFQWPLAAAILLLLAEIFFPERRSPTRRESKSQPKNAGSETGAPKASATMLFMLLLLMLPGVAFASPTDALHDYRAGNYTNALQEYERLSQIYTNDLRLVFNAGAAAYRATNYDEAFKNFQLVTLSPDLKLQQQAFYNLGNTQFRMGQAAKDLDDLQNTWELAVKSYGRAHALDTNDVDAAYNIIFVKNYIAQIAELRELARQAKEAADDATRKRDYHRALEIMISSLQKNPATKQLEDYIKKLKQIDDIATPNQP